MTDYEKILTANSDTYGGKWRIEGDTTDYNNIVWKTDMPPNKAELDALWDAVAIERARTAAYTRIKEGHAEALRDARERYSDTEREGWSELVTDAQAGEGSVIEGYADELGISVADAAERILTVREGYRQLYGQATGKLTRLRDAVDAAESVEALNDIDW